MLIDDSSYSAPRHLTGKIQEVTYRKVNKWIIKEYVYTNLGGWG
ncbi:hypothetical protein GCM10028778_20290 [Barrientosiimonas marina]